MVRPATREDAPAIAEIYNYYIQNTVITFETEDVSAQEMETRIRKVSAKYPWLVFEEDGVKIVVSHESLGFLDGSEIDFVSEGLGTAFRFNNPNATDECGCGESFTIEQQ